MKTVTTNSIPKNLILALCVGILFLASTHKVLGNAKATTNISYSYNVPYEGAWNLIVQNNSSSTIIVNIISFNSNTNVQFDSVTKTPSCWGDLWAWGSTMDKNEVDESNTSYTVHLPAGGITLEGNQKRTLTCQYTGVQGPLPVAMNATDVTVNGSAVDIAGKCSDATCINPIPGKWVMGYYTDWDQYAAHNYNATDLPISKINAVNYAFLGYDKDGNIKLLDSYADSKQLPAIDTLRTQYPYLNAAISFGGWSLSADFPSMASNSTARANFVTNTVTAMRELHFNAIDIDWEYPEVSDANNFIALLHDLRTQLDTQGAKDNKKYYLTIAAPAGIDKINNLTKEQWQAAATYCDYVDIMTYDFHGAWDTYTDFMSAMQTDPKDPSYNDPVISKYDVTDAVMAYINNGVPATKIVLGIPTYGRATSISGAGTSYGLYQKITGTPDGEFDKDGVFSYKCISDHTLCYNNGSLLQNLTMIDPTSNQYGNYAKTPWGYSDTMFLTYDDDKSAAYKVQWAKEHDLGGTMVWTFSEDNPKNHSIVDTIYNTFKSSTAKSS